MCCRKAARSGWSRVLHTERYIARNTPAATTAHMPRITPLIGPLHQCSPSKSRYPTSVEPFTTWRRRTVSACELASSGLRWVAPRCSTPSAACSLAACPDARSGRCRRPAVPVHCWLAAAVQFNVTIGAETRYVLWPRFVVHERFRESVVVGTEEVATATRWHCALRCRADLEARFCLWRASCSAGRDIRAWRFKTSFVEFALRDGPQGSRSQRIATDVRFGHTREKKCASRLLLRFGLSGATGIGRLM